MNDDNHLSDGRAQALRLEHSVAAVVLGQQDVLRTVLIALFARGHVLLEGGVGVGKTTILRAFARVLGGAFARIEGSVDLMPNDLLYHAFIDDKGNPRIERGPLIAHEGRLSVFFFNEINRARAQVQALLLRAMAEKSVEAFGSTFVMPHMLVFADRNRVEKEETFELSAAARDRFMFEINVDRPQSVDAQRQLLFDPEYYDTDTVLARLESAAIDFSALNGLDRLIQQHIRIAQPLQDYVLRLWQATWQPEQYGIDLVGADVDIKRLILSGASVRGMAGLIRSARVLAWLHARDHVLPEDVHYLLQPCLGHRIFFAPLYEMRREVIMTRFLAALVERIPAP